MATRCDDVGDGTVRRGAVVILPEGDSAKQLAFQLVMRDDAQSLDICATDPRECIVARRQMRFQPRKTVEVAVPLKLNCKGKICPLDQTCVEGTCVSAQLPFCNPCGEPDGGTSVPDPPTAVTADSVVVVSDVTTMAGSTAGFADGTAQTARFDGPAGVAVNGSGMLAASDFQNHRIRALGGKPLMVTSLAGSGNSAWADGAGPLASFDNPAGLAMDGAGNTYVADSQNHRIRTVTSTGVVATLAGSGTAKLANGVGTLASFSNPCGVAVDSASNVYVADTDNNLLRKVTSAGAVTTLAGTGNPAFVDGLAMSASFNGPTSVAVDGAGNVYVADRNNHSIRKVTGGVVTTLAGSGTPGWVDGTGTAASFTFPTGVAVDWTMGNVYVADTGNNRIRKVTSAGVVTTLAGSSAVGRMDGRGSAASFNRPRAIAVWGWGHPYFDLFIADYGNSVIRTLTTYGSAMLAVSWLAPSDGGVPITSYAAAATTSGQPTQTCTTNGATSCVLEGLASNVAYTVIVTATNALGTSAPSAAAVATPN